MTYKKLLEELNKLNANQLALDVTIEFEYELYPGDKLIIVDESNYSELDKDHPIITIE